MGSMPPPRSPSVWRRRSKCDAGIGRAKENSRPIRRSGWCQFLPSHDSGVRLPHRTGTAGLFPADAGGDSGRMAENSNAIVRKVSRKTARLNSVGVSAAESRWLTCVSNRTLLRAGRRRRRKLLGGQRAHQADERGTPLRNGAWPLLENNSAETMFLPLFAKLFVENFPSRVREAFQSLACVVAMVNRIARNRSIARLNLGSGPL
jgi:hypothetical protein